LIVPLTELQSQRPASLVRSDSIACTGENSGGFSRTYKGWCIRSFRRVCHYIANRCMVPVRV